MKRSEMLDHIKEDLLEKLKHRWLERGETDKWAEFTANQLLDMIEGFGMLGPKDESYEQYYARELGYETYQDYLACSIYEPRGGWEPEDE